MSRTYEGAFLVLPLLLAIGTYSAIATEQGSARSNQSEDRSARQDLALRDVFLGKEDISEKAGRVIGRLGISLSTSEGFKLVRADYSFRSGDRFRFHVTANRNGWLYVLHAAPGGSLKQLWPKDIDNNAVNSGQSYEIPAKPGIFIFDKETGQEYFYISIRLDRKAPNFEIPTQRKRPIQSNKRVESSSPTKPSTTITNFLIRDPFGGTGRGVVFDPGQEDGDPYLYFSATAEDTPNAAMIEFQLHHVD